MNNLWAPEPIWPPAAAPHLASGMPAEKLVRALLTLTKLAASAGIANHMLWGPGPNDVLARAPAASNSRVLTQQVAERALALFRVYSSVLLHVFALQCGFITNKM